MNKIDHAPPTELDTGSTTKLEHTASVQRVLLTVPGGQLVCPTLVLCDRGDGGHLVVNPPRRVWERNCLKPSELALWSLLVAATGQAMLDELPQLAGGCLNYWEAGNWALHAQAQPIGPKDVHAHRQVHLHVFGRGRHARHPDWQWGESPRFPMHSQRLNWASEQQALSESECNAVAQRCSVLFKRYHKEMGEHQ